jgi:hypothetical protein
LRERLGDPYWRSARDLDRTLASVNKYLDALPLEQRQALAACKPAIEPPAYFEVKKAGKGIVHFTSEPFEWRDDELDEIESACDDEVENLGAKQHAHGDGVSEEDEADNSDRRPLPRPVTQRPLPRPITIRTGEELEAQRQQLRTVRTDDGIVEYEPWA